MTEYGNFRFNLGPGEDKNYHESTAVGMRNVTAGFGKYNLEEIGQEFRSSANSTEMSYILPNTVGGTKVHLLLGVKKTRIQPVLIRVLSSGVEVYLSPLKDVWGSRIIFAGPSKVFTQANRNQQRESNHAVYSLYSADILGGTIDHMDKGDVRFDSICKMKTSSLKESIKDRIRIDCSYKAINLSEQVSVTPSVV